MPDPHIQFDEDRSLADRRLKRQIQYRNESGMTNWVMRKLHISKRIAQTFLVVLSIIFFAAAVIIFITRFII